MASFYERSDSPYYWVRVLRPDGTWASERSKIRKDAPNAGRKIRAFVAQMTIREMGMAEGRGSWDWIPSFLRQHCASEKTLTRYLNAWSALEVYLRAKGIHGSAEVTYKHCVDYPVWLTGFEKFAASCLGIRNCVLPYLIFLRKREVDFKGLVELVIRV